MSIAFPVVCGPSFPVELTLSLCLGQRYAELKESGLAKASRSLCSAIRVSLLNSFFPQHEQDNSLLEKFLVDIPI